MKKTLIFSLCSVTALLAVQSLKAQSTLADWTFESSASTNNIIGAGLTSGTTQSGVSADIGTGTASASHASSATAWSIPAGNGSAHSWSANNWAQGDFFQFSVTLDLVDNTYSGFNVTYDQNGSATGPKTYYIAYSTDGLTFTPFGSDYTLTSGITWASGTPNQATQLSDNFSPITALDTASTIYFRIVDDSLTTGGAINGGNIGTSGTDRIDNFLVSASVAPVPEPTTMALAGLSALSLIVFRRQRK
jgi:hypothetical protein